MVRPQATSTCMGIMRRQLWGAAASVGGMQCSGCHRGKCRCSGPEPTAPVTTHALQPKKIEEIKKFLLTARRKDAKSVKIKKSGEVTKFKVRCSRYLYTLCVADADKADKLKQSLPPGEQGVHTSAPPDSRQQVAVGVARASSQPQRVWLFWTVVPHVRMQAGRQQRTAGRTHIAGRQAGEAQGGRQARSNHAAFVAQQAGSASPVGTHSLPPLRCRPARPGDLSWSWRTWHGGSGGWDTASE